MRRVCLIIGLLLWAAPAHAAIAFVTGQTAVSDGNDATLTFPGNWTEGNVVLVATRMGTTGQTIDLTDISETESVLHGPADVDSNSRRIYIFCFVVDASADATVIVTTSGASSAQAVAAEFSGATCTEDGTSATEDFAGGASSWAMTTDLTVSVCGSMVVGWIIASNASDFVNNGSFTPIGNGGHNDAGDIVGGNGVGVSLFQYRVTIATGDYDAPFTVGSGTEDAALTIAAIQPSSACAAGGGRNLLLMGVG